MKVTKDAELRGTALVFNGMNDFLEVAKKQDPSASQLRSYGHWGIQFQNWEQVTHKCNNQWSEGTNRIQAMGEEIAAANIQQPVSIRRIRRWSEDDGDVDVDRALSGESYAFRELHRTKRPRSQNIALICDIGANCNVSNEELFWRSAASIVAIDLLEEAGYNCEVWAYTIGRRQHVSSIHPHGFTAIQIKDAGSPVDVDTMAKVMSPWFFRSAMFAAWRAGGETTSCLGYRDTVDRERWFTRYCDCDVQNQEVIWMPITYSRTSAIAAVKTMIETIQQPAA